MLESISLIKGIPFVKRIILVSIAFAFLVSMFVDCTRHKSYDLVDYGLHIQGIEKYKVIRKESDYQLLKKGNTLLKIKIFDRVSEDESYKLMSEKRALLNGLFEPQLPPYPEFITNQTGCKKKFLPRDQEINGKKFYLLYAGKRLGYGICIDDLVEYAASMGLFYCSQSEVLFQIEFFLPKNSDFNELIALNRAIECIKK